MNALPTRTAPSITPFSAGQLWQYHTRPGEEDSCVLINLVEEDPLRGRIFHISIFNVQISNPLSPEGLTTELSHFPVAEESLRCSLTRLIGLREPDIAYMEGYRLWREAFDEGKAGIFTVSVAEIIGIVAQAICPVH